MHISIYYHLNFKSIGWENYKEDKEGNIVIIYHLPQAHPLYQ